MNRCSQAGCTHTDLKCYRLALRGTLTTMCGECAQKLIALGMAWQPVERRQVSMPVIHERRKTFRPAWLGRLTPRDETMRMAAA